MICFNLNTFCAHFSIQWDSECPRLNGFTQQNINHFMKGSSQLINYVSGINIYTCPKQQIAKFSMGFNLLHALQPLSRLVPEVAKPTVKPNATMKTAFTAMTLFIYLICCQIPIYGILRTYSPDPLYWTRVILASSRGTLMELGIGPIISAGWIIQIVNSIGILKVSSDKDGEILEGFEKTFALILCFGQAAGQIWYGAYGPPSQLSYMSVFLIITQLMASGIMVILLDSMLKQGYGLGSGISLFIVANTSENLFWSLFSPVTQSSEYGIQFEGSFICLIHFLLSKPNKWNAVYQAFTRTSAPNLMSFCATLLIFFIVIYLQSFQIRVPLIHQQHKGYKTEIPIKLFYTSNMSVILQSMFVSNFYIVSRLLYEKFSKTVLINLIGKWEGNKIMGGLVWYISPPIDFQDFLSFPYRLVTYVIFVCGCCAFFSRFWIEISKQTPRAIALKIRSQGLTLPSYRSQSVYSVLNRYIPTAAMLGGIVIGLLTIMGDFLNAIGSSTGILLSVSILYRFHEKAKQ